MTRREPNEGRLIEQQELQKTDLIIGPLPKKQSEQNERQQQEQKQRQQQRPQEESSNSSVQETATKSCSKSRSLLTILTALSVLLGCVTGLLLRKANLGSKAILLIGFPGEIMMNMLKMMTIPLVVSSLVSGLASLSKSASRKIGIVTSVYYTLTTFTAVFLGIAMVSIIHPGSPEIKQLGHKGKVKDSDRHAEILHSILDIIRNLVPNNLLGACFQQSVTVVKIHNKTVVKADNSTGFEIIKTSNVTSVEQTNVIGLVSVSIFLGVIINQMGAQASLLAHLFNIMSEVVMLMIQVIMWYSPIGIFSLIAAKILTIKNLLATLRSLGLFIATVTSGLVIHAFVTLTLTYLVLTRKNPLVFLRGICQAMVTALGTASSAATLPITLRCLEENNGIDKRVTRFVLPIGATVNMDGTALYEAVASIFIAQVNDMQLKAEQIFAISLTATLAAMGAASVPSAGVVTMVMVLTSVGLPVDDIPLILTVDWLLDRIRTTVNVIGDAFGAGIVDHLCKDEPNDQFHTVDNTSENESSVDAGVQNEEA